MLKNLLDNMKIDVLNAELYTVGSEWQHENVNSPYSRLYYVTEGKGYITFHGQKFELSPGFMYLIPSHTLVDLYCPDSFTHYYIHFITELPEGHNLFSLLDYSYKIKASDHDIDRSLFDRLLDINPGMGLVERDANMPIYKTLLERCEEMNRNKTASQLIENNAMIRLALTPFLENSKDINSSNVAIGINRFHTVIKYINKNLDKIISLSELAELVDLNPAYFSANFSKLMGVSPVQYINKKRIEKAQMLLLTSNSSLYQIAQMVGFEDVFYFSRVFKKITSMPPAKYRNQTSLH
jgi:AraC-like DNA-binding protein